MGRRLDGQGHEAIAVGSAATRRSNRVPRMDGRKSSPPLEIPEVAGASSPQVLIDKTTRLGPISTRTGENVPPSDRAQGFARGGRTLEWCATVTLLQLLDQSEHRANRYMARTAITRRLAALCYRGVDKISIVLCI